jgi:hypothetical protein
MEVCLFRGTRFFSSLKQEVESKQGNYYNNTFFVCENIFAYHVFWK